MSRRRVVGVGSPRLFIFGLIVHASAVALSTYDSEDKATQAIGDGAFDLAAVTAADVEDLVHRGWHEATRALVSRSQAGSDQGDESVQMAAKVREAVRAERNRLDDLIRILDRNYGKAVDVSPAMQWAQNSTHVFLAVKFAQRWNAPGALEVENMTVAFSDCCLNFTAFGEHSMIRRRYQLSFDFFKRIVADTSSWHLAAAGRMSLTIAKADAANWPRMLSGEKPQNLGVWRDMRDKWAADLEKYPQLDDGKKKAPTPASPTSKKAKRKAKRADDEDEDESLDRETDLLSDCAKSSYTGTSVSELCADAWPAAVESPSVKGRSWLVEFYSSDGKGDLAAMKSLMPVWKRLADVFPSLTVGGRVGALDCAPNLELCKKLGVAKLPQVRRYGEGRDGAAWPGNLDATIEEFAAFGAGHTDEL